MRVGPGRARSCTVGPPAPRVDTPVAVIDGGPVPRTPVLTRRRHVDLLRVTSSACR
ncbi:putative leader peptide [Pseudonocardia broussonetiae]|uniref:putative leader peptide n=1 Tax=Pseudonocardia broussonetiae TaxID=2736640 RepID=UPI003B832B88